MKNVQYSSVSNYANDLLKSLSNFCSKSPIDIKINYVKDMNKIYLNYNDETVTIDIDPMINKKKVIGDFKKKIQKHYPFIYKLEKQIPSSEEVEKLISKGFTLKDALSKIENVEVKCFKVIRAHQNYNELDLLELSTNEMFKYKCKVPVSSILERLKYKDTTVLEDLKLMYKLEQR